MTQGLSHQVEQSQSSEPIKNKTPQLLEDTAKLCEKVGDKEKADQIRKECEDIRIATKNDLRWVYNETYGKLAEIKQELLMWTNNNTIDEQELVEIEREYSELVKVAWWENEKNIKATEITSDSMQDKLSQENIKFNDLSEWEKTFIENDNKLISTMRLPIVSEYFSYLEQKWNQAGEDMDTKIIEDYRIIDKYAKTDTNILRISVKSALETGESLVKILPLTFLKSAAKKEVILTALSTIKKVSSIEEEKEQIIQLFSKTWKLTHVFQDIIDNKIIDSKTLVDFLPIKTLRDKTFMDRNYPWKTQEILTKKLQQSKKLLESIVTSKDTELINTYILLNGTDEEITPIVKNIIDNSWFVDLESLHGNYKFASYAVQKNWRMYNYLHDDLKTDTRIIDIIANKWKDTFKEFIESDEVNITDTVTLEHIEKARKEYWIKASDLDSESIFADQSYIERVKKSSDSIKLYREQEQLSESSESDEGITETTDISSIRSDEPTQEYSWREGENTLTSENGEEIPLSPEDISALRNNPENLESIVELFREFQDTKCEALWPYKEDMFTWLSNQWGMRFSAYDGEYIDKREANVLFSSILYVTTEKPEYKNTWINLETTKSHIKREVEWFAGEENVRRVGNAQNPIECNFIDKFTMRSTGDSWKFHHVAFAQALKWNFEYKTT